MLPNTTIEMRYLLIALTMLYSTISFAQEKADTVTRPQSREDVEISMSLSDLEKLKSAKENAETMHASLLQKYKELLKQDSIKTARLLKFDAEYPALEEKLKKLQNTQVTADKCLLNTASNFLYIPYEAYSVQEIAIPAFEAVSSTELKDRYAIKLHLLKSYQMDIKSLLDFISTAEKELNNPFAKNARDLLTRFHNTSFYVGYRKYDDWENTYLGLKMISVENQLKAFDGKIHKLKLETIKNGLNSCLKTIENL